MFYWHPPQLACGTLKDKDAVLHLCPQRSLPRLVLTSVCEYSNINTNNKEDDISGCRCEKVLRIFAIWNDILSLSSFLGVQKEEEPRNTLWETCQTFCLINAVGKFPKTNSVYNYVYFNNPSFFFFFFKKDNLIEFRCNWHFTNQKTPSRYQTAEYDVSGKGPTYWSWLILTVLESWCSLSFQVTCFIVLGT